MYQTYIDELAQSATQDLFNIPKISFVKHIKHFARKYIKRELVEPIDYINWPKGCLMVGLMANQYTAPVQQYLDMWIKKGARTYTIDDCLTGQALMQVYQITENPKYLYVAEKMMNFLYQHEKDSKGSLPYRPLHKTNHIYADGIGMVCPFAIYYGILKKENKALELAMNQIRSFLKYGMDEKTGLPYHLYQQEKNEKLGLLGWGRAVGWICYGLAASIEILQQVKETLDQDQKQYKLADSYEKELRTILNKLLQVVIPYKTEDGLYTCSFTQKDAQVDTSATAMILYAEAIWKNQPGKTPGDYVSTNQVFKNQSDADQSAVGQATDGQVTAEHSAIVTSLTSFMKYIQSGQVLQAQSECLGLGQYGESFASYPWSVGMGLKYLGSATYTIK